MASVNYVRDVLPFDDATLEFTDTAIARELNGQTLREIGVGDARVFHADAQWWILADTNIYEGEFQVLRDDTDTPAGVKSTLKKIWQIIFGFGQGTMNTQLRRSTSGEPLAAQFAGDLAVFADWTIANVADITTEQWQEFWAIGGGLKYPAQDVTAADVAASREAYNADVNLGETRNLLNDEYVRLYNIHIAPILQSNDIADLTDQAMKDALVQMSVGWVDQVGG